MTYSNSWSNIIPTGSAAPSTVDNQIRQLRLDIQERMDDIVEDWTSDPVVTKSTLPMYVRAYRSAALVVGYSLTLSSWTTIAWDAESFDSDDLHDLSTNPSRITVPTITGTRLIKIDAKVSISPSANAGMILVDICKGGTEVTRFWYRKADTDIITRSINIHLLDTCVTDNYYEVRVTHNLASAGDEDLDVGSEDTSIEAVIY